VHEGARDTVLFLGDGKIIPDLSGDALQRLLAA